METIVAPVPDSMRHTGSRGLSLQVRMRETPLPEWLNVPELSDRLSGTLKKNARIGFGYMAQLRHEALCQVLGWGFESLPSACIVLDAAATAGDCPALTEAGWHTDRLLSIHPFDEDEFMLKYLLIRDTDDAVQRQGVGIVVRQTSVQWLEKASLVFALLTEYDRQTGSWTDCINPF